MSKIKPEHVNTDGQPILFLNHYECKTCQQVWHDLWSCMCDDECPVCGTPHTPTTSQEIVV